jgi:hypothetical protein
MEVAYEQHIDTHDRQSKTAARCVRRSWIELLVDICTIKIPINGQKQTVEKRLLLANFVRNGKEIARVVVLPRNSAKSPRCLRVETLEGSRRLPTFWAAEQRTGSGRRCA